MEHGTFFLCGFIAYVIFLIWLGWFVSRNQKTSDDFLLAGRGLPLFLTLGTTVATFVGTGSSMGAVSLGYSSGWAGMLYGIGGGIGGLLVAWWVAPAREKRFMTMAEELSYYAHGDKLVKNVVGVLTTLATLGWLGAHILGGSMYLSWATGIDPTIAKILIALAFTIFTYIGGYLAVVWTDTIQAIVLFFGFILMTIMAVVHVGGFDVIFKAVDPKALSFLAIDKLGVIPAISLAFAITVGLLATPSYRQRIYSAKNVRAVRLSFCYSGVLYMFFSILPAIIGMAVYAVSPDLPNRNFAFLQATTFLPAGLGLIVLIAGLSATMSSASSDALSGVTIVLRDCYAAITGHMPAEEKGIKYSRIALILVVGLATLFAMFANDLIGYITKMISTLMAGMAVCTVIGVHWERYNWQGAIATLVGGSAASTVVLMNASWMAYWGNPTIPAVIASFVLGIGVTLMTQRSALSLEQGLDLITRERENTQA